MVIQNRDTDPVSRLMQDGSMQPLYQEVPHNGKRKKREREKRSSN